MPTEDKYVQVAKVTDIRNKANGGHDMGNLQPGQVLHIVESYQGWLRFDEPNLTQPGYNETWVLEVDTTPVDEEPPPPPIDPPSDTTLIEKALAEAFVDLMRALKAYFKS